MQMLTYIDNNQKSSQSKEPAFGNTPHAMAVAAPATSPNPILGNISPDVIASGIKLVTNLLGGGQEQQRDPFEVEIYKGMRESFVEGFKSYIATVNQNAQIGAQVLEALKKGTLKLDAGTEKAAEA